MYIWMGIATHRYRVTHSDFTTFKGLEMWLKWYAHKKSRHYLIEKDPPFTLNHQLISADYFNAVKLDLTTTSWFFLHNFCYFHSWKCFAKNSLHWTKMNFRALFTAVGNAKTPVYVISSLANEKLLKNIFDW